MTKIEPKIGDIWRAPNGYYYLIIAQVGPNFMLSSLKNPDIRPIVEKFHFAQSVWKKA